MFYVNPNPDEFYYYSEYNKVKGHTYYRCCGCAKDNNTKNCSRAKVNEKNEVRFTRSIHLDHCKPLTKTQHLVLEAKKTAYFSAREGTSPEKSYTVGWIQPQKFKVQDFYGPIFKLQKVISCWYRKNYPKAEMGEIPKEFFNLDPETAEMETAIRWLLLQQKDVAIFATDEALKAMASAPILCADGTYKTKPDEAAQIFYIHGLINGEWIVLLSAIMKSTTEADYDVIVQAVKEKWEQLGVEPKFERLHTEKLYGCLFHYSQAILRNCL
uniref:MULE transposase domain-containing protein n=1 Tax=Panagrolaimus sp. JU765 TaxID=591449 RepID=A0AC34RTP0_9BILA